MIKTTATVTPTKRKIYFATKKKKKHNNFHFGWTISFEMKRKNEAVTPWVSLAQDVSNL